MDDGCLAPVWVPVKPSRAEPSRGRTLRTVPEEEEEQDARVSSPAHSGNTRLGEFHSAGSQVLLSFLLFTCRSLFTAQINDS